MICETCGRDPAKHNTATRECSHPDCSHRGATLRSWPESSDLDDDDSCDGVDVFTLDLFDDPEA